MIFLFILAAAAIGFMWYCIFKVASDADDREEK